MVRTLEINWLTFQVTKMEPRIFNNFERVNPLVTDVAHISIQISELFKKINFD